MKPRSVATVLMALALLASVPCPAQTGLRPQSSAAPLPASLPLRRDTPAEASSLGWWPSLALLTFAGAGGAWTLLRRRAHAHRRADRGVQDALRLSSAALTPHASVHVVRWNEEELLVGCTAQHVCVLARRPAPHAPGEQA